MIGASETFKEAMRYSVTSHEWRMKWGQEIVGFIITPSRLSILRRRLVLK